MGIRKTLTRYYRSRIRDASLHFDLVETTVSHLLRHPHPALAGRTYGGAFLDALLSRGLVPGGLFVEVGGGTGWFARGFLERLADREPARYQRARYLFVDLSPVLAAAQRDRTREHAERVRVIRCDAQDLPFATGSIQGTILTNEVVADFDAVRVRRAWVTRPARAPAEARPALEAIRRYDLDLAGMGHSGFLNLGAIRLVEEAWRALAPGGTLVIAEYGGKAPAREAVLHDGWWRTHTEYSIHYGHLRQVAGKLGFETEIVPLYDFLGLRDDVRVANYTEVRRLRWLGRGVEVFAYTEEMLRDRFPGLLDRYEVRFRPIGSPSFPDDSIPGRPGGFRALFKALLLAKPRTA